MAIGKNVGVIILNYNKSSYTIDCAKSILDSDYKNILLFIIDNGSEYADFAKLNFLKEKDSRVNIIRIEDNCGYVGGVNKGIKAATDSDVDYYLVMNNDTIIDKKAITELVSISSTYNNNCIVSGKVYNIDEPDTLQYIGQKCKNKNKFQYPPYIKNSKEKDIGQYDNIMEMGMLDDVFWLFSKRVFNKVGYYSDYFFLYGEQNDYALRAVSKGVKLVYTPKAKIWHYHHLTTGGNSIGNKRIQYWQAYAFHLLTYLHLTRLQFLTSYFRIGFELLYKGIGYIVLLKFSKMQNNYMPKLYGFINKRLLDLSLEP